MSNTSEDMIAIEDESLEGENIEVVAVEDKINECDDAAKVEENAPEKCENPEAVIEAVLFAMGESVEYEKLASAIGFSIEETKDIVHAMQEKYSDSSRGVSIIELEDSVQMCTKTEMYEYLIKVAKIPKNLSLTDTLLETLSIVAYKQPVTRAEIEKIRGVSCDHAVNKLLEYGLICELGRLNAPGRPLLFGTTEEFLRSFGVKSIDDLPSIASDRLEEFKREASEEVQLKLDI